MANQIMIQDVEAWIAARRRGSIGILEGEEFSDGAEAVRLSLLLIETDKLGSADSHADFVAWVSAGRPAEWDGEPRDPSPPPWYPANLQDWIECSITVKVTAQDIADGEPRECGRCPIALALGRMVHDSVEVGAGEPCVLSKNEGGGRFTSHEVWLQPAATDWMVAFDQGKEDMEPVSFGAVIDAGLLKVRPVHERVMCSTWMQQDRQASVKCETFKVAKHESEGEGEGHEWCVVCVRMETGEDGVPFTSNVDVEVCQTREFADECHASQFKWNVEAGKPPAPAPTAWRDAMEQAQ